MLRELLLLLAKAVAVTGLAVLLSLWWLAGARAEEPVSAPLDEALALVLAASPAVSARRLELAALARQSDWRSRVRLSYAAAAERQDSLDGGLNARLEVEIPLFDRSRELESAQLRQRLAEAEQALIRGFLADLRELIRLHGERREALALSAFYADRLNYHKAAEREGMIEAAALWPQAEAVAKAEHQARQTLAECDALLESIARQYGAGQWPRLKALLRAHTSTPPR